MITMSLRGRIERTFLTLFKRNLQFEGAYNFIVKEKRVLTRALKKQRRETYTVYLKSENGLYEGTMIVLPKDFYKMEENTSCGRRGVVSHKYKNGFHVVTRNTEGNKAITEVIRAARIELVIYLGVVILIIISLMIFGLPLLKAFTSAIT